MKGKALSQNMKYVILGSFVLVAIVGISAARYAWVMAHPELNPDAQALIQAKDSSQDKKDTETKERSGNVSKLPAYANSLEAKQNRELQDFEDLLERSVWTNQNETQSLKFEPGAFVETSPTSVQTTEYKITGLQKGNTLDSKDVQGLSYTANFITQKGSYLVNVTQLDIAGQPSRIAINSDVFSNGTSYMAKKAATDVKVENIEGLKPYVAGHDKELIKFVQEKVSKNFPTVNVAKWTGIATVSQKEQTVQFSMELNNAASTNVNFFYHVGDHSFTTNCEDGTCNVS